MKPVFNKPKNFKKGLKDLGTYKLVPGYWISLIFSPSKNSLRKKETSSSTQPMHTLNRMAKRNIIANCAPQGEQTVVQPRGQAPPLTHHFQAINLKLLSINCTCWGHTNRVLLRHNWAKWVCSGVWHIWSYSSAVTTNICCPQPRFSKRQCHFKHLLELFLNSRRSNTNMSPEMPMKIRSSKWPALEHRYKMTLLVWNQPRELWEIRYFIAPCLSLACWGPTKQEKKRQKNDKTKWIQVMFVGRVEVTQPYRAAVSQKSLLK